MVKDRETTGDSTKEVGESYSPSLPRIIEESMCGTKTRTEPWYAFVSPWKLITYFYPLLHITIRQIRI
jgi:hypothetical protein